MRHSHRRSRLSSSRLAFTLVELLVVIAIIGTLVGLLLPAVQSAREAARSNTCRNNLTQLQKALTQRETTLGDFPGYINALGLKGTNRQIRASWVVTTFPYVEQQALFDRWSQDTVLSGGSPSSATPVQDYTPQLEILICPSDPPTTAGAPLLSYVANSGWIRRTNQLANSLPSMPGNPPYQKAYENPANGVFLDRTRYNVLTSSGVDPTQSHIGPKDYMDNLNPPAPMQSVTVAYIQAKGDGTTSTLLLSENLRAVTWAYTGTNYGSSGTSDEKYHFGFCWEQPEAIIDGIASSGPEQYYRMNAPLPQNLPPVNNPANYEAPGDMSPVDGFASSNHPGGVNVAFVGGSVQYVADQMEPRVYAQLMTSNRNQSDLHVGTNYEKNLAPLSESEY